MENLLLEKTMLSFLEQEKKRYGREGKQRNKREEEALYKYIIYVFVL